MIDSCESDAASVAGTKSGPTSSSTIGELLAAEPRSGTGDVAMVLNARSKYNGIFKNRWRVVVRLGVDATNRVQYR